MALPHDVLGVSRDASMVEITAAYRKLAMKHHPDRPGGSLSTFQAVKAAYEALRAKHSVTGLFDDLISAAAEANKKRG